MNAIVEPRLYTPDELEAMPDGNQYELIDGVLKERVVGADAGWIGSRVILLLQQHCSTTPAGWVFTSDPGYRCFPGRPRLVRKPDVSFVRLGRFPDERVPRGDITLVPDLVVEVVSPNDLYEEVEQKVAEYRSAGVPLVWLVIPGTRTVLVRRADGTATEAGPDGTLDGEDVLPGFRVPVAELFRPPLGVTRPM
jgi:Uma2 family endonuclease